MFDLGLPELLVIGIVALIVIGPKDLPVMFRNVGRFVGRMKAMAREFTSAMNQAADESGVRDLQKTLRTATDPLGSAMDGVKDATKDATSVFTDLDLDNSKDTASSDRENLSRKIEAATARNEAEKARKEAEAALKRAETLEAEMQAEKDAKDG